MVPAINMQIFRPKRSTWLSLLWMSPFFLGWLIFSIKLGQGTGNVWLAVLRCFGPAILPVLLGLYQLAQLRHYQIRIDPQGITFVFLSQLGKAQKPLSVRWTDIVQASWHPTAEMLTLVTTKDFYLVPLKDFDGLTIWYTIKQSVPPTALNRHQDGTPLPDEFQPILDPNTPSLHLSPSLRARFALILAFLGLLRFSYFLSINGVAWAILCLSPGFFVTFALAERDFKQVEVSHAGIHTTLGFVQKFIAWSEITSIWWSHDGGKMEIHSEQRRILIPGPTHWSSLEGQQLMIWLSAKTWQRGIPFGQKLSILVNLPVESSSSAT